MLDPCGRCALAAQFHAIGGKREVSPGWCWPSPVCVLAVQTGSAVEEARMPQRSPAGAYVDEVETGSRPRRLGDWGGTLEPGEFLIFRFIQLSNATSLVSE